MQMQTEIKQIIEKHIGEEITDYNSDLQITDKLTQLEIIMDLEEKFNIKIDEDNCGDPKSLKDYMRIIDYARDRLAIT